MGAQLYTEREESERLAIYEESKRKAKQRYETYVDAEDKLRMIAEMELMLMDPKQHLNKEMIWIEMKSLTDNVLSK